MVATFPPKTQNPQQTNYLCPKHLAEWVEKSGVKESTVRRNVQSISKAIASSLLGYTAQCAGWWVSGINLKTGQRHLTTGQFKPDEPWESPTDEPSRLDGQKKKPPKYRNPLKQEGIGVPSGYDAIALETDDPNYWQTIIDDPTISIVVTEGAKKAGCGITHGLPTLALMGICMWHPAGKAKELVPSLEVLCVPGRTIYIAFDSDMATNKDVRREIRNFSKLLKEKSCEPLVVEWPEEAGKGMDDFLVTYGAAQFLGHLEAALTPEEWAKKWEAQFKEEQKKGSDDKPSQMQIAARLAEYFRPHWAWRAETKQWFRYGEDQEGVWGKAPEEVIHLAVQGDLEVQAKKCQTNGFVEGVIKLLRPRLRVKTWEEAAGKLPFENGVLDLQTRKFEKHAPGYRFRYALPYKYDPKATCEQIQKWLWEAVEGHEDRFRLLRAWLNAVVVGRSDLQMFLEMTGPGATGKSTFIRLAQALVGRKNSFTTDLKQLENNRFELSGVQDKRLVIISDSERYGGEVSKLKALTGEDELRSERKFVQNDGDEFVYGGLVMVAANEPIMSSDYTSGLSRRRLQIPFTKRIPAKNQRNLISLKRSTISGEFAPEISGLLNWVLELSDAEVKATIAGWESDAASLREFRIQSLLEHNPVLDWLDHIFVLGGEKELFVGVAQKDKDKESPYQYRFANEWLYASYREYTEAMGNKALSGKKFTPLLREIVRDRPELQGVRWGRNVHGSYFTGLSFRIRGDHDHLPRPISGMRADEPPQSPTPQDPGPKPAPQSPVELTAQLTASLTAETLATDASDGTDGSTVDVLAETVSEVAADIPATEEKQMEPEIHQTHQPSSQQASQPSVNPSSQPISPEPVRDRPATSASFTLWQCRALIDAMAAFAPTSKIASKAYTEWKIEVLRAVAGMPIMEFSNYIWLLDAPRQRLTWGEKPDYTCVPKREDGQELDYPALAEELRRISTIPDLALFIKQAGRRAFQWLADNCLTDSDRKRMWAATEQFAMEVYPR